MDLPLTRYQRIVVGVAVLAALIVGMFTIGVIGIPSLEGMTNQWGEVEDDRVEVRTQLDIHNPNPLPLGYGLDEVEYTLSMNQIEVAEGVTTDVDLPSGSGSVNLSTYLRTEAIPPWWASHIENDEVSDVHIDATVHVSFGPVSRSPSVSHEDTIETDLEATLAEALEGFEGAHTGPSIDLSLVTVEPTVEVTDTDAMWGSVTEDETEVLFDFTVHNPNEYPIPTPAFTGALEFNEIAVGDWDAHEVDLVRGPEGGVIPAGETRELRYAVMIDNHAIAQWFPTHVEGDESSDARITGQLALQLSGHTMTIPPDDEAIECTFDLQTAILVEQPSGVSDRTCTVIGMAPPTGDELEDWNASLDLEETDWWETLLSRLDEAHRSP